MASDEVKWATQWTSLVLDAVDGEDGARVASLAEQAKPEKIGKRRSCALPSVAVIFLFVRFEALSAEEDPRFDLGAEAMSVERGAE